MSLARLLRSRAILPLALAAIVAMAFLIRFEFVILLGGLESDQIKWAQQNYVGDITLIYLQMRDAILSWTAERQLSPYLPGYPAFLAALHAVGVKDLVWIRVIQAATDAVAIIPLYFVLRSIGVSIAAGLVAALIYAVAPWWGAGSTLLVGESLLPALMILFLAGMVIIRNRADSMPAWFLLGLLSSILPFFRSEMMFLVGPLVIWALMHASNSRRIFSSASVAVGFVLPLLLWSVRNDLVHDHFLLTPPAKWYAAWSGLGQVANGFGYFVSDVLASKLLATHNIVPHSVEAEAFWKAEYLKAWGDHPVHVLRTILFRLKLISAGLASPGFVPRIVSTTYEAMAFVAPVVLAFLLYRRRWSEAFLIVLPMAYALGTLGVLYVELRYVRYAGLTYLFVLAFVLSAAQTRLLAVSAGSSRQAVLYYLRPVAGVIVFLVVSLGALYELRATTKAAEEQGLIARLDTNSTHLPVLGLGDLAFQPSIPTVRIETGDAGVRLQARAPSGSYLATAPLRAQESGVVIIRYRIAIQRGAIGVGVVSASGGEWLSQQNVPGGANEETEGSLVSRVEPGSLLVIDAQSGGEIEAVVGKLQWSLACPRSEGVFQLFFRAKPIPASKCS